MPLCLCCTFPFYYFFAFWQQGELDGDNSVSPPNLTLIRLTSVLRIAGACDTTLACLTGSLQPIISVLQAQSYLSLVVRVLGHDIIIS